MQGTAANRGVKNSDLFGASADPGLGGPGQVSRKCSSCDSFFPPYIRFSVLLSDVDYELIITEYGLHVNEILMIY